MLVGGWIYDLSFLDAVAGKEVLLQIVLRVAFYISKEVLVLAIFFYIWLISLTHRMNWNGLYSVWEANITRAALPPPFWFLS